MTNLFSINEFLFFPDSENKFCCYCCYCSFVKDFSIKTGSTAGPILYSSRPVRL